MEPHLGQRARVAIVRRRSDRAQRLRARRHWWDRHGAFLRGLITGLSISALAYAGVQAVVAHNTLIR